MKLYLTALSTVFIMSIFILLWGRSKTWPILLTVLDNFFLSLKSEISHHRLMSILIEITSLGSATIIGLGGFISFIAFILSQQYLKAILITIGSCSGILGTYLKKWIGKIRPENSQGYTFGSSFPSNHTLMSSSFYPLLYGLNFPHTFNYFNLFFLLVSLSLPLWIGISRIVLRAHFFSDVLAGWLLGGTIAWACLYVQ